MAAHRVVYICAGGRILTAWFNLSDEIKDDSNPRAQDEYEEEIKSLWPTGFQAKTTLHKACTPGLPQGTKTHAGASTPVLVACF